MGRSSRLVLRHRTAVVLAWLVLLIAGGAAAGRLSGRLSHDFAFPGLAADGANHAILATYGNGAGAYPLVPVVVLPEGVAPDDPAVRRAFDAAAALLTRAFRSVLLALKAVLLNLLSLAATYGVLAFGRWNWWLPSWSARLLRVPGAARTAGAEPRPPAPAGAVPLRPW